MPERITFAEMRNMGIRGVLIYCADYRCSQRCGQPNGWEARNPYVAGGKNLKPATASLSGDTQTGSLTVSASAIKQQVGQLNRCKLVTGANLISSDRYHCISMPQFGQVGASSSSSECFSLSITTLPEVE
jgi:hypothetical protein